MKPVHTFFLIIAVLTTFTGCGSAGKESFQSANDMKYASFITMSGDDDGELFFRIGNPWKTGKILRTYRIGNDIKTGFSITERECEIHTPVTRAVVMTNSHARLLSELGLAESIAGVCESEYITDTIVRNAIASGRIRDCGNSMRPDIERIISLNPDAIFVSPFEETGYGQLEKLGIPLIECADYMESSPLGRAEWMRFYGRLFNEGTKSDSLFDFIRNSYLELKDKADSFREKPTVMLDTKAGSAWYVAGGGSTIGQMIADAGGEYIFKDRSESGSVPLSFETVYEKANEADIWLMKNSGDAEMTYESLKRDYASYEKFKPFRQKRIWVCDVYQTPYFEMTSFHPEILLREFIAIFHDENDTERKMTFYHPMEE